MPSINHLDTQCPRWFAIYTGFRKEKAVHSRLQKKQIHSYLPIQNFRRAYGSKVTSVDLPLISCYVFVHITKPQYVPVLETEYVLNFVKFANDLISIPQEEIEWMKRILEDPDIDVEVLRGEDTCFEVGDRVEIISGRLAGLQGRLLEKNGKQSFLVELAGMGQSLNLTIGGELLRKV